MHRILVTLALAVIAALGLVTLIGSGSSGGGSNTVNVPLGTDFQNVAVQSGGGTRSTTYDASNLLSQPITAYERFVIDLDATMANVQISSTMVNADETYLQTLQRYALNGFIRLIGIERALAAVGAEVNVYVSWPGDPDVCNGTPAFGPFAFTGDVGETPMSEVSTATTDGAPRRVDVIAFGTFELCVAISTAMPMDMFVSVSEVVMEAEPCDEPETPAEVEGMWMGTYTCEEDGMIVEGGDITLSIEKNEDGTYSYSDDEANYTGHFCGTRFKFTGGVPGDYKESGTFDYFGDGQAEKNSTYYSDIPNVTFSGDCTDDLTKVN